MGFLEDRDFSDIPSIPEFYKGKTIFITGGSGFMGQVLIEKLLYSCSELDRIYLIMRRKNGVTVEQRLADMYSTTLFDRLRTERPGLFESKVHTICGDIRENELGISKEDQELLKNSINIIFHCAASIRFNDYLRDASNTNLRSTRELVNLAADMKKLLVFVHVSTCYANTNHGKYLEEKMYPPHSDWRDTMEICENLDQTTINYLTPKYIGDLPNTYVFTKQLAEHLVFEQKGKLPVVIIRPSVVISMADEPLKGWINNYNGPIAICIGVGKGVIRNILGTQDLVTDYIPVDYCIKHFITAAWVRGTKPLEPTDDVPIYNCSSYKELVISLGDLIKYASRFASEYPLDSMINLPYVSTTSSPFLHYIQFMIYQLIPALAIDALLWIFGKKTLLVKIQRRIYHVDAALYHYLTHEWHFDNRNFLLLRSCIKEQDRKQFDYDLKKVSKELYIKNGVIGGKKYLLQEKLDDYPKLRKRLFWVKVIFAALKLLIISSIIQVLMKTSYFKNTVDNVLKIR